MSIMKSPIFAMGQVEYDLGETAMRGIFNVGALAATAQYRDANGGAYVQCDAETRGIARGAMSQAEDSVTRWIGITSKLLSMAANDNDLTETDVCFAAMAITGMVELLEEMKLASADLALDCMDEIESDAAKPKE
jgi:hypothetical protein